MASQLDRRCRGCDRRRDTPGHQSGDRRGGRRVRTGHARRRRHGGRLGPQGACRDGRRPRRRTARPCWPNWPSSPTRTPRHLVAEEVSQTGKPVRLATEFDVPGSIDNIDFFAGAARHLEGKATAEYSGRPHLEHPARRHRRRRHDHAVELPAADGGVEGHARVGRRLLRGDQARRDHPADHADAGPAGQRGRPARRRAQRRHRRGRRRGHGTGRARGRGPGDLHRLDGRGPQGDVRRRRSTGTAPSWNWAARRRSWCSTTPTWTPPSTVRSPRR